MKTKYLTIHHLLENYKPSHCDIVTHLSGEEYNLLSEKNDRAIQMLHYELTFILLSITQRKMWKNYKISVYKIQTTLKKINLTINRRIQEIISDELFMRDVIDELWTIKEG